MVNRELRLRRVLFVCTGNTCRSVLAEYLGRRFHGESFTFESAGTRPQDAADAENAVHTLRKTFDIDASAHPPRNIRDLNLTAFETRGGSRSART
jgi:protein-tyrosine-phosphatase